MDDSKLQAATGRVFRAFLRRVRAGYTVPSGLTAAPDDPLTLGQVSEWWSTEVDEGLMNEILSVYTATYRDVVGGQITETSMDAARDYLARVKNRLTGDVAEDAFDRVRVATAQGLAEGWSRPRLSERIAAELSWTRDRDYWSNELSRVNRQIDEILDPLGPPGSSARETARLNDPIVELLQRDKSRVQTALDAEQSHWQSRADRIARTETTGATGHASNMALRDEGQEMKTWLAAEDARTRPSHNEADGQTVPVSDPFIVGGVTMQNPGDPSAPSGETVNCRCTIIGGDPEEIEEPESASWSNEEYSEFYERFENRIPDEVADSIAEYRADGYEDLNRSLRNEGDFSDRSMNILDGLMEAFDQVTPLSRPTRVHRGIGRDWDPPQEGVVVDEGFMSTSTDRDYALRTFPGWILDIDVPEGTRAVPVGQGERELLFEPGTAMRILSIDRQEGTIHMEMIP